MDTFSHTLQPFLRVKHLFKFDSLLSFSGEDMVATSVLDFLRSFKQHLHSKSQADDNENDIDNDRRPGDQTSSEKSSSNLAAIFGKSPPGYSYIADNPRAANQKWIYNHFGTQPKTERSDTSMFWLNTPNTPSEDNPADLHNNEDNPHIGRIDVQASAEVVRDIQPPAINDNYNRPISHKNDCGLPICIDLDGRMYWIFNNLVALFEFVTAYYEVGSVIRSGPLSLNFSGTLFLLSRCLLAPVMYKLSLLLNISVCEQIQLRNQLFGNQLR